MSAKPINTRLAVAAMQPKCSCKVCGEDAYCTRGPYARLCGPCKCRVLALMDAMPYRRIEDGSVSRRWMVANCLAKLSVYGEVEVIWEDGCSEPSFRFPVAEDPS